MESEQRVTFVFPVFNEAQNIPRVLADLSALKSMVLPLSANPQFLFIDDGSTDGTAELLLSSGQDRVKVISHGQNRGPGAAFQTAFAFLLDEGIGEKDFIITLEGDATSEPSVFQRMLKRTAENDDIVLASPYLYGGGFSGVSSFRVLLSHFANFLFKAVLGIHGLATFSCFYRIYRGRSLVEIRKKFGNQLVTAQGFECAAEILFKAVRCNLAISEVPFRVDWSRRKGKSKMKIVKTSFGYFRLFARYFSVRKEGLL